ncbi:MAG: ACP S-malonyltransferase [Gammaproteobacteria bacterium]|nr:ACP S-malonyltransferase [Gammaproteobacteria bacterium]
MSTAFIFPGQGSQSIGMMNSLSESHAVVQETFAKASSVLGYDLWGLLVNGPADQLNLTEYTQPAMLTAGVASWRVWLAAGGTSPAIMAGHSLGEYTALVCAGALDFSDAVALVSDRARFMQQAVPQGGGAMAAVLGLDENAVRSLCQENAEGDILEAVNYNAPGQIVVAGNTAAIDRLVESAKLSGAKRAIVLPVSVPSHCTLMKPASKLMAERLKDISIEKSEIPVIHNVNVQIAANEDEIRELLARQISEPVRWVETINSMYNEGITRLVECGPGKVLCGLTRRINREISCIPLISMDSISDALEERE